MIATCPTGKVCYKSRIRALMALAKIKDTAVLDSPHPIRAYRCLICKQHHLTSQEERSCPQEKKNHR
jgi:hypothetical protein